MAGRQGFNPSASIIAYKKYARANLPQNASTSNLWHFLLELSRNDAINSFFNVNDLTQEFIDLEEDYYSLKNHIDFIPFYKSIEQQLKNPKQPIPCQDYWNFLYAAIITKSLAIRNHTKITAAADMFINQTKINDKIDALNRDRVEYIKHVRDEHKQSLERRIQSTIEYAAKNQIKLDEIFNQTFPNEKFNDDQLNAQMIRHHLAAPLKIVQSFLSLIMIRMPKITHLYFVPIVETSNTAYKMQQFSNIAKHFQSKLHPFKEMLRDFGGTFKENKMAQLNELKRTLENLTSKVDEIMSSHKIASDFHSNEWKNLINIIGVTKTHIEMRKTPGINVNVTIDRLNQMQNLTKCSEIGIEAYRLCRNDSIKMMAFNGQVDKFQVQLKKWKEFEQSIYAIVMPWLKLVENSIGNPYVYVNSGHYLSLEQLNNVFEQMQQQQQPTHSNDLKRIISDTKQLIELTLGLYNQIQVQSSREKMVSIIEHTQQHPIQNVSSELMQNKIKSLNETITLNLMLEICMTVRDVLEMQAFPYDQNYLKLCDFSINNPNKQSVNGEHIQQKFLHNFVHSIVKIDQANAKVKKEQSVAFYTWEYTDFKNDIMKLLTGEKVIFNADILTAPEPANHFNAIKFHKIWLNFSFSNTIRQNEFDRAFDGFLVKMKMIGNNCFYRCAKRIYHLPIDTDYLHTYQVKHNNLNGSKTNDLYGSSKLRGFTLSPYTIWQIQLVNTTAWDRKLYEFLNDEIDLQLTGEGNYFENNEFGSEICKSNELFDRIDEGENLENRKLMEIEKF